MEVQQLRLFEDRLPAYPSCTDNLAGGCWPQAKVEAIKKRYIQPNPRNSINWIVFDVDRPGGGHDWSLREAPEPNIVVENSANLHAHLFYGLQIPIHKNPDSQVKPLRYAASIEHALLKKLGGDFGYTGFLSKNPLCDHWNVRTYQQYLYDLDWLADYVDLEPYRDRRRHLPDYGLGRNCTLFDRLRRWAYRARLRVDWPTFDTWHAEVLAKAAWYNDFPYPLPISEIRSTAKSVAGYVWRNFTPEKFSEIQRQRCQRLNKIRRERAEEKRQYLLQLREDHPEESMRSISRLAGIPWQTAHRLISGPYAISDRQ